MSSKEFFESSRDKFDLIYVDGDHRYEPALWDMCKWFMRVREGGLLVIDDYGNIAGVTSAANSFFAIAKKKIGRMGFFDKSFINTRKYIPAIARYVFFEKNEKFPHEKYTVNIGSSARNVPIEYVANSRKTTFVLGGGTM